MSYEALPPVLVMFGPDGVGKTTILNELLDEPGVQSLRPHRFTGHVLPYLGDAAGEPWLSVDELRSRPESWQEFQEESIAAWGAALGTRRRIEAEKGRDGSRLIVVDSSPFHKTWAARLAGGLSMSSGEVARTCSDIAPLLGSLCRDPGFILAHVTLTEGSVVERGEELQRRITQGGRSPFDPPTTQDSATSLVAYSHIARHLNTYGMAPVITLENDGRLPVKHLGTQLGGRLGVPLLRR